MKALSKENTPFVNEVTPADQNNNVQNEDNNGSNKEVNLDDLNEKNMMSKLYLCKYYLSSFMMGAPFIMGWRGGLVAK